jgi:hypothetical protein
MRCNPNSAGGVMQADIKQDPMQVPLLRTVRNLPQNIVERWNTVARAVLVWALVGSVLGAAWTLPTLTAMIEQQGYLAWLLRGILPAFATAFILIATISISVDSGAEMARRPIWFLSVLALGSAVATAATWLINLVLPSGNYLGFGVWFLSVWMTIMVFGGAFGWPAVLNVKRNEEHIALNRLLMTRSLLTRRVAQARLFAARAQVDPEMVARVLTQVRFRYRDDEPSAAALLDQLIAFLRLAMNRKGEQRVPLGIEIDMMRSYAALRQIETGTEIDLQITLEQEGQRQQLAAAPFFLLARHVLRLVHPAPGTRLVLHMKINLDSFQLIFAPGVTPLSSDVLQRLRADISETLAVTEEVDILQEASEKGEYRYVVQAAIG